MEPASFAVTKVLHLSLVSFRTSREMRHVQQLHTAYRIGLRDAGDCCTVSCMHSISRWNGQTRTEWPRLSHLFQAKGIKQNFREFCAFNWPRLDHLSILDLQLFRDSLRLCDYLAVRVRMQSGFMCSMPLYVLAPCVPMHLALWIRMPRVNGRLTANALADWHPKSPGSIT